MAEPVVLYETDEQVGIITLNRPDKLNAISPELQHALLAAFAQADEAPKEHGASLATGLSAALRPPFYPRELYQQVAKSRPCLEPANCKTSSEFQFRLF